MAAGKRQRQGKTANTKKTGQPRSEPRDESSDISEAMRRTATVKLTLLDDMIGNPSNPEVAHASYVVRGNNVVARIDPDVQNYPKKTSSVDRPKNNTNDSQDDVSMGEDGSADEDDVSEACPSSADSDSDAAEWGSPVKKRRRVAASPNGAEGRADGSEGGELDSESVSRDTEYTTRPSSSTSGDARTADTSQQRGGIRRPYGSRIQRVSGLDVDAILGPAPKQPSNRWTFKSSDLFAVPLDPAPTLEDWERVMSHWVHEAGRHAKSLTRVLQLSHQVKLLRRRLRDDLALGQQH